MKKLLVIPLLLLPALWWYVHDPTIRAPGSDISFTYELRYTGGAGRGDSLPLVIALHGNGDKPGHFFDTALDRVTVPARVILFAAPLPMGSGTGWPRDATGIRKFGDLLAEIIEILRGKYPTANRPALFGFSGGAIMAYYLVAAHPDRYSFAVPVSGEMGLEPVPDAMAGKEPPVEVYAFHGLQDELIGIRAGHHAEAVLRARRIPVQLTVFQGGHLGVFTTAKVNINQRIDEKLRSLR